MTSAHAGSLELTYVTAPGCRLCEHGLGVLAELRERFALVVREVDLLSEEGRHLASTGRIAFPPALFHGDRLLAHGRLSPSALERQLAQLVATVPTRHREG